MIPYPFGKEELKLDGPPSRVAKIPSVRRPDGMLRDSGSARRCGRRDLLARSGLHPFRPAVRLKRCRLCVEASFLRAQMRGRVAERLRAVCRVRSERRCPIKKARCPVMRDSSYPPGSPSPPSMTEETVSTEGGLLFEHEVGGVTELCGQDTQGLSLGVFFPEA
jgi:hypothetical protein